MSANQLMWLYIIMRITATGVKLVLRVYCRSSGNKIVRAYAKVGFTVEVPETRLSVPMLRWYNDSSLEGFRISNRNSSRPTIWPVGAYLNQRDRDNEYAGLKPIFFPVFFQLTVSTYKLIVLHYQWLSEMNKA